MQTYEQRGGEWAARRGRSGAAWANVSYLHPPSVRVPLALAHLHQHLAGATRLGRS